MKQLPLPIGLQGEPGFDNFLVGVANAAALKAMRDFAPPTPPVYLWGPSGSGKSHLLRALARRIKAGGGLAASFDAATPLPWQLDEAAALLVLDDTQHYDDARQHAAFALFVDATTRGVPIASAGRLPPVDLPLREDLRTRLGWGVVHALQPIADADIRTALSAEAHERGLQLPPELLDYLLTRHARDLGVLMGLLHRLDAYALSLGRPVTVPLFKQMLSDGGVPA